MVMPVLAARISPTAGKAVLRENVMVPLNRAARLAILRKETERVLRMPAVKLNVIARKAASKENVLKYR
jgi:hypothetical protein